MSSLDIRHFPLLMTNDTFTEIVNYGGGTPVFASVIYSYLVYSDKIKKKVSLRTLSEMLGIHVDTVKKTVDSLHGLIDSDSEGYFPVENGHYFRDRKTNKSKHWSDKYAYTMLYILDKDQGFTLYDSVIYSYFLCNKRVVLRGIAKILSISEKTAKSSLERLVEVGLLDIDDTGKDVLATAYKPENHRRFFATSKSGKKTRVQISTKKPVLQKFKNEETTGEFEELKKSHENLLLAFAQLQSQVAALISGKAVATVTPVAPIATVSAAPQEPLQQLQEEPVEESPIQERLSWQTKNEPEPPEGTAEWYDWKHRKNNAENFWLRLQKSQPQVAQFYKDEFPEIDHWYAGKYIGDFIDQTYIKQHAAIPLDDLEKFKEYVRSKLLVTA